MNKKQFGQKKNGINGSVLLLVERETIMVQKKQNSSVQHTPSSESFQVYLFSKTFEWCDKCIQAGRDYFE
jgi:hypothetical protein